MQKFSRTDYAGLETSKFRGVLMVKFFIPAENGGPERTEVFKDGCWVDMVNPTDDECEDVSLASGVPEYMIKAALDEEERARADFDDGCSMFILDCPIIEETANGDSYTTLPLAIIYNEKCILTVCLKGNNVLKDFIVGREKIFCEKHEHFALTFMMGNVKRFLYCLKQIDRKNHRIQSEVDKSMRNEEIIQLLDLQNSLVYFSTSLNSNERVHEKFCKAALASATQEYLDFYEDISIENKQAIETCNIYKNILSVTMDAYGSVISNNANDSMKKLTIITILLAAPTLIAGLWGMNMPVPFQQGVSFADTIWFWVMSGVALVITVVLAVILFKGKPVHKKNNVKKKKKDKKDNRDGEN